MSLSSTPSGERVHIAFFGLRNAGKSSLVNAVTGQQLAVVSDVKGTTTDPVKKAMELLPIGPVVIVDTPGIDDEGALGELRVQKTEEVLSRTDIAVLVHDVALPRHPAEEGLLAAFERRHIPYIIALNKTDVAMPPVIANNEIVVSAKTGEGVHALKERLAALAVKGENPRVLVADLLAAGDVVVLVTPIDEAAPKGRLILPQQMTLRDILDAGGIPVLCQPAQLTATLAALQSPPRLVITDSQVFGPVAEQLPAGVPLTSFSILMARYKGDLLTLVEGAKALASLQAGDKVLVSEGCTHHRQCGDIGTEKLPAWIEKFAGVKPDFAFTSGGEFPADLSGYKLVVHCGGCMLNEKEMASRLQRCRDAGVPVVNYGVAIAHIHGILARSLEIFPAVKERL